MFVFDSFINPSFLKDKAPLSYSVTNRPSLSKSLQEEHDNQLDCLPQILCLFCYKT